MKPVGWSRRNQRSELEVPPSSGRKADHEHYVDGDRNPDRCRRYERQLHDANEICSQMGLGEHLVSLDGFRARSSASCGHFRDRSKSVSGLPFSHAGHNSRSLWIWCGLGSSAGLFRLAVDMIGITLAFSIVLGTSAAVGSLIPMVSLHREHLNSAAGYAVLGANALVLLGVTLCAAAGKIREGPSTQSTSSQKRTSQGLLLSILCGLWHPS